MSKILISGYYGFANAGDEAMLTAIVCGLKAAQKDVEITVLSGRPAITATKHKVNAINRFAPVAFLRALWHTDLLLSGGGSLLQDVTSSRSLFYYLSILFLGKLLGKKVMLFAQGIGPINSPLARKLTRFICKDLALITVRDDGSLEELKNMGFQDNEVLVTSDAVFSLPEANRELGQKILLQKKLGAKPLLGFALRHWQGEERFSKEFAKAADALQSKYEAQIVFIPLQFPVDLEFAKQVRAQMRNASEVSILEGDFTTEEYLAIISNLRMLIGMRLHALVFAALCNVPFLAISYDPKVDRFVHGMGGEVLDTISQVTSSEMVEGVAKVWERENNPMTEKILLLRREAKRNINRAIALLD